MPKLGPKFRTDKAVYWALLGPSGDGSIRYAAPVEIKVRWSDKEEEFFDDKGRRSVSKTVVHVDRDVTLGGYLWHGELTSLTSSTRPQSNQGAEEIRGLRVVKNFKGTETFRRAFLGGSTHG